MRIVRVYRGKEFDIILVNGLRLILCNVCENASYNHVDIAEKYCANCHKFHESHPDDEKVIGL